MPTKKGSDFLNLEDRERQTDTQTHRDRQTEAETKRQRDTERGRQRQTEKERMSASSFYFILVKGKVTKRQH